MKKVLFTTALALVACVQALAANHQTQSPRAGSLQGINNVAPRSTNASETAEQRNDPDQTQKSKKKDDRKEQEAQTATASAAKLKGTENNSNTTTDEPSRTITNVPVSSAAPNKAADVKTDATANAANASALTNVYRVGIGDILDIRILNSQLSGSTLYTVLAGGMLEYTLAGEAVAVAGLTTDEIAARLTPLIKIYDKPQVTVNVREYASHYVIVTGLVHNPGSKVLRREAMPLYVVLTDAQPRSEAGRATIMRAGGQHITIDLADTSATSLLVYPGDIIKLLAAPPQFFFIGGPVASPGQKTFHHGLTLTQAILASGGLTRFAGGEIKVSRQGADGRLVTTKYNLKKIEKGQVPDPLLQPGDRVEVSRGSW
jgi:protein involved in polysaccharide export with SLBB domain